MISIHALRVESDEVCPAAVHAPVHFYPRSPCGERRAGPRDAYEYHVRISIHALRVESDFLVDRLAKIIGISIHALRVESDRVAYHRG